MAACLVGSSIDVVFRYYSGTTRIAGKRLTTDEAKALSTAGLLIGVVYEDAPTNSGYFTSTRGRQDGERAWQYAQSMNQPSGSAIYFAVDYPAGDGDIPAIVSYFQAIQTALADAAGKSPGYAIGVYGEGKVCQAIKQDQGIATYAWLAAARGWPASSTYGGWDVIQTLATSPLCGLTGPQPGQAAAYEECQAQDSFGGFTIS